MTAHNPITAACAVAMVEAIGVADARQFIADQAAACLVKSYAATIDTKHVGRPRQSLLGAAVAPELWERIIAEGALADVWDGGTVRLASSEMIGGRPAVHITAIGFKASDLDRVIEIRRGAPPRRPTQAKSPTTPPPPLSSQSEPIVASTRRQPKAPDLSALHSGALHLSVQQTKAALSIGHTTLYKLLNAGELDRAPSKAGTRITADSVRRYAGLIS